MEESNKIYNKRNSLTPEQTDQNTKFQTQDNQTNSNFTQEQKKI